MTSTIGIDPGLDGAVACLDEHGEIEDIFDMPTIVVGKRKSGKHKRQLDAAMIGGILAAWQEDSPLTAVMEQVNASPGMGSVSAFTFGESVGILKGVLGALMIPLTVVTPKAWKGYYELPGGREQKRASLELANAQWSHLADREWFRLVKHADRAEAALLALYAQSKLG